MQAVISGLMTNYHVEGAGKAILFLHGWGDTGATFNGLRAELKDNYRVVTLDLPGFGATSPPETVWGLEDYAAFVAEFTRKLKLEVYGTVAHSNGGAVAIKATAMGFLNPERLILLASAGIRDQEKARKLVLKIVAKIGKVLTFWAGTSTKRKLQKKLYGAAGSDMLVAPHLKETFKKTVQQDIQQEASTLKVPTLLIYGTEDKATPLKYGQLFSQIIPGSRLQALEGAGHFVHHDNLDEVAELIKEFLK